MYIWTQIVFNTYHVYLKPQNIIWTTIMNITYLEHLKIVVNDIQSRG
jgi:hypothetical protein